MHTQDTSQILEHLFKALGSSKRMQLVSFLSREKRATVGDIAGELRITVATTSRHLAILKNARIVESERVHGFTYYELVQKGDVFAMRGVRAVIAACRQPKR